MDDITADEDEFEKLLKEIPRATSAPPQVEEFSRENFDDGDGSESCFSSHPAINGCHQCVGSLMGDSAMHNLLSRTGSAPCFRSFQGSLPSVDGVYNVSKTISFANTQSPSVLQHQMRKDFPDPQSFASAFSNLCIQGKRGDTEFCTRVFSGRQAANIGTALSPAAFEGIGIPGSESFFYTVDKTSTEQNNAASAKRNGGQYNSDMINFNADVGGMEGKYLKPCSYGSSSHAPFYDNQVSQIPLCHSKIHPNSMVVKGEDVAGPRHILNSEHNSPEMKQFNPCDVRWKHIEECQNRYGQQDSLVSGAHRLATFPYKMGPQVAGNGVSSGPRITLASTNPEFIHPEQPHYISQSMVDAIEENYLFVSPRALDISVSKHIDPLLSNREGYNNGSYSPQVQARTEIYPFPKSQLLPVLWTHPYDSSLQENLHKPAVLNPLDASCFPEKASTRDLDSQFFDYKISSPPSKANRKSLHNNGSVIPKINKKGHCFSPRHSPSELHADFNVTELENLSQKSFNIEQPNAEFKSLDDIKGHIYTIAKDQHGCRFLQKKFEEGSAGEIKKIFVEIIEHITELMTDPFGNYLVQKLLDVCNNDQLMEIIITVTRNPRELVNISLNMHGTRAVQKLIETLNTAEQVFLVVRALEPGAVSLIKDLNGNHVVQRCLQCLSKEDNQFLFDAAARNCVGIATHRHGCCVLQRCIDHSSGLQRDCLVSHIAANALLLSQDQFGNYVVQYILDLQFPWVTAKVVCQLEGHFVSLSVQKFSSNVVEKCLKLSKDDHRAIIVEELLNTSQFEQLLQDPFANYVIQSALSFTKDKVRASLVDAIRPHIPTLRSSPFGKRILSRTSFKR